MSDEVKRLAVLLWHSGACEPSQLEPILTRALRAERATGRKELLIEMRQRYAARGTGLEILMQCHGELDNVCRAKAQKETP